MDLSDIKIDDWDIIKWFARPALVEKNRGSVSLYSGQSYDLNYFDLVLDGWNHDHCLSCFKRLSDYKDEETDEYGYFYQGEWICESCFIKIKHSSNSNNI